MNLGTDFFDMILKLQQTDTKTGEQDNYTKCKRICTEKPTIYNMKSQTTEKEVVFANSLYDDEFTSGICEEHRQSRKANNMVTHRTSSVTLTDLPSTGIDIWVNAQSI